MDARLARHLPRLATIPLVLGVLCRAPARAADPPELPRYRLQVGQELEYRGSDRFDYENGSLDYRFRNRAWVTRQNPDGSWRVVLCFQDKMSQQHKPREATLKSAAAAALGKAKEVVEGALAADDPDWGDLQMAYVDLFPDGRAVLNESITGSFRPVDVGRIFPPLPADAAQAKGGWHHAGATLLQPASDYRLVESSPAGCEVMADHHNMFDQVYLMSSGSRFAFDRAKGIITRVDTTNAQGYGFVGKGAGRLDLVKSTDHGADRAATMAAESEAYFAAERDYQESMKRVAQSGDDVAPALTAAEAGLKRARGRVGLPMFAGALDAQLKELTQNASYYAERAKAKRAVVGQPAADWELKDLEGRSHTLGEYRGRVVVLDFWYRGCGWCIRAMPQMKQLADDFRDQPVAILGLNKDRDIQDARFVADRMGLNYTTLVGAEGVPEKYHVRGFPTLVVVDPQGQVAEFHVGYSPELREEIGAVIRRLLPGPKVAGQPPRTD